MDDKVEILAEVCHALAECDKDRARVTLIARYPFEHSNPHATDLGGAFSLLA